MILRPYQKRVVDETIPYLTGTKSPLIVLPTGGGKTVIAKSIIEHAESLHKRVLFIAHRTELIAQTAKTLGGKCQIIAATLSSANTSASTIVASLDTLIARKKYPIGVDLVIVDEAHHGPAKKWAQLKSVYAQSVFIGLTATPVRSDGKPLGAVFDTIIIGPTVRELTDGGYLVPCDVIAPRTSQRGLAIDPTELYTSKLTERKTVIFADQIKSAERYRDTLVSAGYRAGLIHGKMPSNIRQSTLSAFKRGELACLINVAVLTEGWDDPGVTDCVLARKCDSIGLYRQIIGRILRTHPGKTRATLWDLTGACREHGLPDSEYTYSLDGEPITRSESSDSLKQCLRCGHVYSGRTHCLHCGAKLGASKAEIKLQKAELVRVAREEFAQASAETKLEMLGAYLDSLQRQSARVRGDKIGWIKHRLMARFEIDENIARDVMRSWSLV